MESAARSGYNEHVGSILVALDLSDNSMPAARAAAWLCRELGFGAILLYAVEPEVITGSVQDPQLVESHMSWAIEKMAAVEREIFEGVHVERRVLEGVTAASEGICDAARDVGAKLIVMGTHGRTALEHAVLGSTATSVVRHAERDVLTVRPPLEGDAALDIKLRNWFFTHGKAAMRRILCPTDFSAECEKALKRAAGLALHFDAELILLHVVTYPFWATREEFSLAAERLRAQAIETMDATRERVASAGGRVASKVVDGVVGRVVVEQAKELEADLIVMGTHGRTGIKRWAIGSIAERVVRSSHVPVWTVRVEPD